jgi:hypothetical protein
MIMPSEVIILSEDPSVILLYPNADIYTFSTIENMRGKAYTCMIWEKSKQDCVVTIHLDPLDPDIVHLDILVRIDAIKDVIETCCLVDNMVVFSYTDPNLKDWVLQQGYANNEFFDIDGPSLIRKLQNGFDIVKIEDDNAINVISNTCWDPNQDEGIIECIKAKGINKVNLALSMYDSSWKSINKHFVMDKARMFQKHGMNVHSLNALFYMRLENVFDNAATFYSHFKKMLGFAYMMNCKKVIYSSPSSRWVKCRARDEYNAYQASHDAFIKIFKMLAKHAALYDITIYIKANNSELSNYLIEHDHVIGLILQINEPNVCVGPSRNKALNF